MTMASQDQQPVIGQYMYVPSPSANSTKISERPEPEIFIPKIVTNGKISLIREAMVREATISPLSPEEYDSSLEYMLTIDLSPKLVSKVTRTKSTLSAKSKPFVPEISVKAPESGTDSESNHSTHSMHEDLQLQLQSPDKCDNTESNFLEADCKSPFSPSTSSSSDSHSDSPVTPITPLMLKGPDQSCVQWKTINRMHQTVAIIAQKHGHDPRAVVPLFRQLSSTDFCLGSPNWDATMQQIPGAVWKLLCNRFL